MRLFVSMLIALGLTFGAAANDVKKDKLVPPAPVLKEPKQHRPAETNGNDITRQRVLEKRTTVHQTRVMPIYRQDQRPVTAYRPDIRTRYQKPCNGGSCENLAPLKEVCARVELDDDDWGYIEKNGDSCWWAQVPRTKYRTQDFNEQKVTWCQPLGTPTYKFTGPSTGVVYEFNFGWDAIKHLALKEKPLTK